MSSQTDLLLLKCGFARQPHYTLLCFHMLNETRRPRLQSSQHRSCESPHCKLRVSENYVALLVLHVMWNRVQPASA